MQTLPHQTKLLLLALLCILFFMAMVRPFSDSEQAQPESQLITMDYFYEMAKEASRNEDAKYMERANWGNTTEIQDKVYDELIAKYGDPTSAKWKAKRDAAEREMLLPSRSTSSTANTWQQREAREEQQRMARLNAQIDAMVEADSHCRFCHRSDGVCRGCNGTGGTQYNNSFKRCRECNGTGRCQECRGTGRN